MTAKCLLRFCAASSASKFVNRADSASFPISLDHRESNLVRNHVSVRMAPGSSISEIEMFLLLRYTACAARAKLEALESRSRMVSSFVYFCD